MILHLTGPILTGDDAGACLVLPEAWVVDGRITYARPEGAETARPLDGVVLPGLVDVHCHIGLGANGPVSPETAVAQGREDVAAGVLLVRDAGSPLDTRWVHGRSDMPRLLRAGQHIARTKRYFRYYAVELESASELPEEMARQARAGDGWVKIVADWIDRSDGPDSTLGTLWDAAAIADGVAAAHENGARVTAHAFSQASVGSLIEAGIDCIEHGTGMTADHIAEAARRGIAITPTMVQVDRFTEFAAAGESKFPRYAADMRAMHARRDEQFQAFVDAGLHILPGSDAGGELPHGLGARELMRWVAAMTPADAVAWGTWRARQYLAKNPWAPAQSPSRAEPSSSCAQSQDPAAEIGWLREGDPADLAVYPRDPRDDIAVLEAPSAVVLRGEIAHLA